MKTLYYKDNKVGHKILASVAAVAVVVLTASASIYIVGKRYRRSARQRGVPAERPPVPLRAGACRRTPADHMSHGTEG